MTPLNWQEKAVREVGDSGNNAVLEITLPFGTASGAWLLSANGILTPQLDAFITASELQAALQDVPAIGVGNILVSGMPLGPFQAQLVGALGGQVVPDGWLSADGSGLSPSGAVTVVRTKQGRPETLSQLAALYWDNYEPLAPYPRYLKVKIDLLQAEMGRAGSRVDSKDGDAEAKESQWYKTLESRLKQTKQDLNDFDVVQVGASSGQTVSSKIAVGQNEVDAFEVRRFYGRSTFPFR